MYMCEMWWMMDKEIEIDTHKGREIPQKDVQETS